MKKLLSVLALLSVMTFAGCNKDKKAERPGMKSHAHVAKKDNKKKKNMKKKSCKPCNKAKKQVRKKGY